MLDRLPAWGRHAVILCVIAPLVALIGVPLAAILAAGGVLGVDWHDVLVDAVNAAGTSLATGIGAWIASYVSPLTRQYGVGRDAAGEPDLDRSV